MTRSSLIETLIKDTQDVINQVSVFTTLDEETLSQKPSENEWSILECVEHLNIAQSTYFTQFEKMKEHRTISASDEFSPGWIGNYFVKSMKPLADGTIPAPMKTMKKFRPSNLLTKKVIDQFLADQKRLLYILDQSTDLNFNKIKIKSAIGSIVTFRLGDAFRFVIGHNQRHVVQMNKVLEKIQILTLV